MLSNQAKRQGSFYVCAPCRRQYQQNLTQLRSGGRIRSFSLLSKQPCRSTTSRPSSHRPNHHSPLPTTGRIDARGYAAWGKFGSNTVPGQNNSAWGTTPRNNQAPGIPGTVPATAWGGSPVGSKIPQATSTATGWANPSALRPSPQNIPSLASFGTPKQSRPSIPSASGTSKIPTASGTSKIPTASGTSSGTSATSAADLRLTWEALSAPANPQPEPQDERTPFNPSSRQAGVPIEESAANNHKVEAERKPEAKLLDELLGRPNPRPAPPGAEFPNLLRRESKANAFRSMSPFNLPSSDRHSQARFSGYNPEGSDFVASPQRPGSPQTRQRDTWSRDRDSGMSRDRRSDLSDHQHFSELVVEGNADASGYAPARELPLGHGNQMSKSPPPKRNDRLFMNQRSQFTPSSPSQFNQSPSSQLNEGNPFAELENAARAQNNARTSRMMPVQDDWGLPESRRPRYDDRRDMDSRYRQGDDLGTSEPGQNPSGNLRDSELKSYSIDDRQYSDQSLNRDDGRYDEGRNARNNASSPAPDQDQFIIRPGRKERDREKWKPKERKKSSRRGFQDEYDDFDFEFEDVRDLRHERKRKREEKRAAQAEVAPKTMVLPEYITVYDLAGALRVKPKQFLEDLEQLGFENIVHDSVMTGETAALVAAEYGFETSLDTGDGIDLKPRPPPEDPTTLPPRPPVVTIMGHVDHGKTTMLDWMRKSSLAAQEHGGITQHIGAFSVKLKAGKVITFLDTPGHAAFLSMRQRGAYVTDIVVLVVAVDDSVMPQTIEALKHAQNAKVPIIVAVNKIDVDPNRLDQVKQDLANNGLEIEDFGGDVQVVAVSGLTGQGMDDLEESILTLSEILDIRAERDGMAEGWVLEAATKKEGKAATILVKRGTLRVGDLIVAGTTYTRIRMMRNEAGIDVTEALPGTAIEIFGGWSEPPMAGDMVLQAPDETRAQTAVDYRLELADRAAAAAQKAEQELANREKAEKAALDKMMEEADEADKEGTVVELEDTGPKQVNLIVRGDVMGSVEAVSNAIMEVGNNEVRPHILRSLPGHITEGDVDLLATATGYLINFNNTIPGFIRRKAADAGVPILDHNIIYEVVDNVKKVLSQDLKPITHQRVLGEAEVLQIFSINVVKRKYRNIAGVKIRTGQVMRGGLYRVMRDGEKIHEGKLDALKQGQKNVSEVKKGSECGMSFDDFDEFQPGDIIQLYEEVSEKRYL